MTFGQWLKSFQKISTKQVCFTFQAPKGWVHRSCELQALHFVGAQDNISVALLLDGPKGRVAVRMAEDGP